MRSVTVTCLYNHNYGAILQAYALHNFQKKIGIDNILLNDSYCFKNKVKFQKKYFIKLLVVCLLNIVNSKKQKKLTDNFNLFLKNYIPTTKEYFNKEDLLNNPPQADFYLTGSDQVFTLRRTASTQRLLQFGNKDIKRYSYAASIREYDLTDEEKLYFKDVLSNFNGISIREQYAKDYILSFSDLNIDVNIDPVFLLSQEEWGRIVSGQKIKEDYILCYPVLGNKNLQKAVDELKSKTGLKVYCVQNSSVKRVKADKYIYDAGPCEFLNLLNNAKYVVTTSFHGTALSILFHKPFWTLIKDANPYRVTDLLKMMNLSDRIYNENTQINFDDIDFAYCDSVIERERNKSFDYFNKIINEVKLND